MILSLKKANIADHLKKGETDKTKKINCQIIWQETLKKLIDGLERLSFFSHERNSERNEKLLFTKTGPMISVASKVKNVPRAEGLHSDLAASNSLEMARRFPKTLESVHSCNNNSIPYSNKF